MKIEKIVIEFNGKKIDLSIKDAKELQKVLDELFGEKTTRISYPVYIERPYYHKPYWYGDRVWCSTMAQTKGTNRGTLMLSNCSGTAS